MFASSTKTMLKNVIRHTGVHNRVVEEAECWNQLERLRETPVSRSREPGDADSVQRSFLYDKRADPGLEMDRGRQQAHMDSVQAKDSPHSTFYTQQLQKLEAKNSDRWGHSGYQELYPDDFDSDRSQTPDQPKRKKLRKKEKKKKKERKKKKVKRLHSGDKKWHKSKQKHSESEAKDGHSSKTESSSKRQKGTDQSKLVANVLEDSRSSDSESSETPLRKVKPKRKKHRHKYADRSEHKQTVKSSSKHGTSHKRKRQKSRHSSNKKAIGDVDSKCSSDEWASTDSEKRNWKQARF